jgi:tight adherence protein B
MLTLSLVFIVFAAVSGLWTLANYMREAGKRRLAKRVKRMTSQSRAPGSSDGLGPQLRQTGDSLDGLVQKILRRPDALRARLAAAGMNMSIGRYGAICVAIAIAVTCLTMTRGLSPLFSLLAGLAGGVALPYAWLGQRIGARRMKFYKFFPDAVALMVRGLKAGLPFGDTLMVVGREVTDPVGEEFRRICDQTQLGQPIEEAMMGVSRRLELPEFNFLITTLSVQRETGGNLAATLENLVEMLRKRQQMKLKVKAMSSEAKASAGIIGALPFIMAAILDVVSHAYLMRLFTSNMGHFMLGMGLCSLLAGVYMMTRMVRFDL